MDDDPFDIVPQSLSKQSRRTAPARSLTTLARVFSGLTIHKQNEQSKASAEDIKGRLGLNLLFDSSEPVADIIFVHGLGGGSRKTWTLNDDPQLFWPKEWLSRDPDFRHVRVHSFGYPADWAERRESILNIHDFANSLLSQLQASAIIRRSKQMPIVFVCHSMGGLVVKQAFILAQQNHAFQDIGKRIHAIYFLATPHHGASSAQLLNLMLKATASGNHPFISDLAQGSPALQAINDVFRHYAELVRLYSLFESHPTSILGIGDTFIVTRTSATMLLPNERVSPLQANHRGVCKYKSPLDPNYSLVRGMIVETLDQITDAWTAVNGADLKTQKRQLRSYLNVSEQLYQFQVDFDEPRVDGSCEWLTGVQSFRCWRDACEPRIFWLRGNPGTGKTFLARYVIDHLNDLGFDCSYFFFRAGNKLHSSLAGCLMSLAWQMAENNRLIREAFLEMRDSDTQFDKENFQSIWRTLLVSGVFPTKMVKPHFWILDGLDECTDSVELFPLFAKIAVALPLQIFLTSRPSPELQGGLSVNGLETAVHEVDLAKTTQDIRLYVEKHMDFPNMQGDARLTEALLEKSEGSFIWTKLVLKELRKAFSVEATYQVLKNVPKEMDQIYLRSLEPLAQDDLRRPAARAILMWASTCIRPLSTTELKHALVRHIQQTFNNLENHISWLCGHLVAVDSKFAVKMVHETARSFLLDPDNGSVIAFSETESHEALAFACLEYLNEKELKAPRGRKSTVIQAAATERSPFLDYAATSFHEHLRRSQSVDEKMVDLLYSFLTSSMGNVLTWVDYVASTTKDLTIVTRAGMLIQNFAKKVARNPMRRTEKVAAIEAWGIDLIRLVGKFGRNLLHSSTSIYTTIPPFCPRDSKLYRQYGHSNRGINVLGLSSLGYWDDCLATIVYRQKGNRAMSLAATSTWFAVGTSRPFVQLYHTSTCQEFASFHHGEPVKLVEFSVTNQWVASAGNKRLCLWDIGSKRLLWDHRLSRPCIAMGFNTDNDTLVVACHDNRICFFNIESGELQEEIPWFMDEDQIATITSVPVAAAFSSDLSLLAFVYRGGHIGIWNWEEEEFLGFCEKPDVRKKRLPFHASSLVFNPVPNAHSLAAAYEQGEILVFDPTTLLLLASYKGRTDNQTLACSPDGRTLISGDASGVVRIFDFQNFDGPDHKLRLLYVISGVEENISLIAFCDNRRFVDIRGPKVKVWEPTVLVRQDSANSETESINSDDVLETTEPVIQETDPITSVTVHPSGEHIFCATQNGLIKVVDTATGKTVQVLTEHAHGDTISWMIFGKSENILASASISSKVIVRRLSLKHLKWVIEATLFEYRMGERIEQLMFNASGSKILVVTTTRDMVYSIVDGTTASASWNTRNPGVWCNDPRDPERLMLFVNKKLRVYDWDGLKEVSPPVGIALDFDLPSGFGIQNVHSGWQGSMVATVYTEVGRARSHLRLMFWDATAFDGANPISAVSPHKQYQVYGNEIASIVGTLGMVIGVFRNRVLFLDQNGWVCSIILEQTAPKSYNRHFFLPFDWLSTNDALLIALTPRNEIAFVKEEELAVIKKGLDHSQSVMLLS